MGADLIHPSSYVTGVVFDTLTNGQCQVDNDIAGPGVVLSFVITALLTTILSIISALLDGILLGEHAVFPGPVAARLSRSRHSSNMLTAKLWQAVIDRLILALADQQLLTGIALMVAGFYKFSVSLNPNSSYNTTFHSSHFNLIVYVSCLCSSSHLASMLTMRKYLNTYQITTTIRIILIIGFATALWYGISVSVTFRSIDFLGPSWDIPIVWIYWTSVMELFPAARRIAHNILQQSVNWLFPRASNLRVHHTVSRVMWYTIYSTPFLTFVLQILLASISSYFVLRQKLAEAPPGYCSLSYNSSMTTDRNPTSSSSSDPWTFGQLLPLFLLAQPLLLAVETYTEQRKTLKEDLSSSLPSSSSLSHTFPTNNNNNRPAEFEMRSRPAHHETQSQAGPNNKNVTTRARSRENGKHSRNQDVEIGDVHRREENKIKNKNIRPKSKETEREEEADIATSSFLEHHS